MYLTYEEYQNMGGSLTEAEFENYAFEAQTVIDWYTFNRLKKDTTFSEDVKRCVFSLIKLAKLRADAMTLGSQTTVSSDGSTVTTHAAIASQSNDGVSVSYNSVGASEVFDSLSAYKAGGEVETTIRRYLNSTLNEAGRRLLYRGVYPDE